MKRVIFLLLLIPLFFACGEKSSSNTENKKPTQQPPILACGDGVCEDDETESSCPADCKIAVCTSGSLKVDGTTILVCNADEEWELYKACDAETMVATSGGCLCKDGYRPDENGNCVLEE